jgi:hypothetical protein
MDITYVYLDVVFSCTLYHVMVKSPLSKLIVYGLGPVTFSMTNPNSYLVMSYS